MGQTTDCLEQRQLVTIYYKLPTLGFPEVHLAFMWCAEHVELPFAHATLFCSPQYVKVAPICNLPTPEEYQAFCTSHSIPFPQEDVKVVLFKMFIQPDGIDFHARDNVASELRRRFGLSAEWAFKEARGSLAFLREETKIEIVLSGVNVTSSKAATSSLTAGLASFRIPWNLSQSKPRRRTRSFEATCCHPAKQDSLVTISHDAV
ncbi:uncharacterized protein PG986_002381 [Apiospora aurea]|uniref:Uncharacterized protein n=1 Tax=Apiospora aurea TaxID=335848 RepID=A0ABR1QZQ5_9PEZI